MGNLKRTAPGLGGDRKPTSSKARSQPIPPSTDVLARVREMLGLGRAGPAQGLGLPDLEELLRATRKLLLDLAQPLGLSGLSRLTKDAIARRVQAALKAVICATEAPPATDAVTPGDAPHKFDLGLPPVPAPEVPTIPWGYGRDRVTAMVVDPERLYVYWEVTDDAIERAQIGLGATGLDAWLNLRVYDVTGRIFDGTNAHSYFDCAIAREDRHWFLHVGKPGSTVCVELGMKSREGYFVRIVRSGRADFPRREPVPSGPVDWLSVRTATGEMAEPEPGAAGFGEGDLARPRASGFPTEGAPPAPPIGAERVGDRHHVVLSRPFEGHWDWREIVRREWHEGGEVLTWEGPVTLTSWEAGPFEMPVELPRYLEERHEGPTSTYTRDGRLHVVYGPWQVVIRGIGSQAERRILAVWELARSWDTGSGIEVRAPSAPSALARGGSELYALGASVWRWLAGSEVRLGGASEVYRVGASELRYRGASETFVGGASERRLRAASERGGRAASEWRYGGASEQRLGGASERHAGGASERYASGTSGGAPARPSIR